jgi:RNase P/RNase MRP subunit POP5
MVRFKNRYIICHVAFHDKNPTTETALTNSLRASIETMFGLLGAEEMLPSVQIKYYDQKYSNVFVVRCLRRDCVKVKRCLEALERVEKRTCKVRAVGTHGKLGSLKENVLEKICKFAVNGGEEDANEDGSDDVNEQKRRRVRRKVEKAVAAMTS